MRTFSVDVFKDRNQLMVDSLMARCHAGEVGRTMQALPTAPCIPSLEVRILRAKLIMEETLEAIEALGVRVRVESQPNETETKRWYEYEELNAKTQLLYSDGRNKPNLVEIFDACCDLEVVVKGCASACGIALQPGFERVCGNNLLKFAPGHSFNAAGKLVKPSNHPKVDLWPLLLEQGAGTEHSGSVHTQTGG